MCVGGGGASLLWVAGGRGGKDLDSLKKELLGYKAVAYFYRVAEPIDNINDNVTTYINTYSVLYVLYIQMSALKLYKIVTYGSHYSLVTSQLD